LLEGALARVHRSATFENLDFTPVSNLDVSAQLDGVGGQMVAALSLGQQGEVAERIGLAFIDASLEAGQFAQADEVRAWAGRFVVDDVPGHGAVVWAMSVHGLAIVGEGALGDAAGPLWPSSSWWSWRWCQFGEWWSLIVSFVVGWSINVSWSWSWSRSWSRSWSVSTAIASVGISSVIATGSVAATASISVRVVTGAITWRALFDGSGADLVHDESR